LYSDPSFHSALAGIGTGLPIHLCGEKTHLDPHFSHLTYGDSDSRAAQIQNKLKSEDLLVFYGSLRDVSKSDGQLVYALIGLYVIDTILVSTAIPRAQWHENAHTRRMGSPISIRLLSVRVPV
jgi:putative DNA base modification enzyme with NMAD domain